MPQLGVIYWVFFLSVVFMFFFLLVLILVEWEEELLDLGDEVYVYCKFLW